MNTYRSTRFLYPVFGLLALTAALPLPGNPPQSSTCIRPLVTGAYNVDVEVVAVYLDIEETDLVHLLGSVPAQDARRMMIVHVLTRLDSMRTACDFRTACKLSGAVSQVRGLILELTKDGLDASQAATQLALISRMYAALYDNALGIAPATGKFATPRIETQIYASFREWVYAKMAEAEIKSQEQLASRIGMAVRSVRNHMRGPVPRRALTLYAEFFGYTYDSVVAAIPHVFDDPS